MDRGKARETAEAAEARLAAAVASEARAEATEAAKARAEARAKTRAEWVSPASWAVAGRVIKIMQDW